MSAVKRTASFVAFSILVASSGFTTGTQAAIQGFSGPVVLDSSSPDFLIVDDGDERVATLVEGLNPDIYVAHPRDTPRLIAVVTDQDRFEAMLEPGETVDYVIRHAGVDYPQRLADRDPSPPQYVGAASQPGGIDEIPFRLGPNNAIHVTASFNGSEPLDLIFDTGASLAVAAEGSVRRGVNPAPGDSNALSLGPVQVSGLPMISIDYRGSLRADGVIGYDAFAGKVVEIDYDRLVLRIHHGRPDVSGYQRIRLTWDDSVSLVPITIDVGGASHVVMANFDTGSKWSISLRGDDPAAIGLSRLPRLGGRTARRADGSQIHSDVRSAPRVRFGGTALRDVQVDVERDATGSGLTHTILGNDFLKRFNLVIDYSTSEVFMRPNGLLDAPYNRPGLFAGLPRGLPSDLPSGLTVLAGALFLIGLVVFAANVLRGRNRRHPTA